MEEEDTLGLVGVRKALRFKERYATSGRVAQRKSIGIDEGLVVVCESPA